MPIFALGGVTITITGEDDWATAHMKMQWRNMSTQVTTGGEVPPFSIPAHSAIQRSQCERSAARLSRFDAATLQRRDGRALAVGPQVDHRLQRSGRCDVHDVTLRVGHKQEPHQVPVLHQRPGRHTSSHVHRMPSRPAPPRSAPPHPWQSNGIVVGTTSRGSMRWRAADGRNGHVDLIHRRDDDEDCRRRALPMRSAQCRFTRIVMSAVPCILYCTYCMEARRIPAFVYGCCSASWSVTALAGLSAVDRPPQIGATSRLDATVVNVDVKLATATGARRLPRPAPRSRPYVSVSRGGFPRGNFARTAPAGHSRPYCMQRSIAAASMSSHLATTCLAARLAGSNRHSFRRAPSRLRRHCAISARRLGAGPISPRLDCAP